MDFPQIMGRQRLKENMFRDECIFIYSLSDKDITMEEFKELSDQKLFNSRNDIANYNAIKNSGDGSLLNFLSDIRDRIKNYRYQNDYTGINSVDGSLVINRLVLLAERRAFELRSDVYKTTVSVYNEFSSIENIKIGSDDNEITQICLNARKQYERSNNFVDKMKILCSLILDELPGRISISELTWINREHLNYLNYLGAEKIRSLSYAECTLKREISGNLIISDIRERIISCFIPGKKYLLSDIKVTLRKVYDSFNLSRTAKATDLMDYFEVRLVKIYDSLTKKQSSGYEIIRIKE
jgi:hypothetical protein